MGSTFTVYHDGSLWLGLLEIADEAGVRAARTVFGAEPTGPELAVFAASRAFDRLLREASSAPPVPLGSRASAGTPASAKRAARQAARERDRGVSTAAQAALAAAFELRKADRKVSARERRAAEAEHRRQMAIAKAKARRRGH